MTSPLFNRGIPTAPDVAKIVGGLGDLEEGQLVEYVLLESLTGLRRGTARFANVASAFKRKMFAERNLVLEAVPNEGYRVLPPKDRVAHASRKAKSGFRAIRKGGAVARGTDVSSLTPQERRTAEHVAMLDVAIRQHELVAAQTAKFKLPERR